MVVYSENLLTDIWIQMNISFIFHERILHWRDTSISSKIRGRQIVRDGIYNNVIESNVTTYCDIKKHGHTKHKRT